MMEFHDAPKLIKTSRSYSDGKGRGIDTVEWEVVIVGNENDLSELAMSLQSETLSVTKDRDRWVLKSDLLNVLSDYEEVENKARNFVDLINGACKITLGMREPIKVAYVIQRNEDGTGHMFVTFHEQIAIRDSLSIRAMDGEGQILYEIHPADPVLDWFKISLNNDKARTVLRLLGTKDLDWVNLYRVYEIIRDDVGDIAAKGWATNASITRFTGSANNPDIAGDEARHGVPHSNKPMKQPPMTISEARALIIGIVHNWLSR